MDHSSDPGSLSPRPAAPGRIPVPEVSEPASNAGGEGGDALAAAAAAQRSAPAAPPTPPLATDGEPGRIRPLDPAFRRALLEPRRYALPSEEILHPKPPERSHRPGWGRTILVALAAGVLGAALALAGFLVLDDDPEPVVADSSPPVTVIERIRTEVINNSDDAMASAPIVAKLVIPSIVTVEVDTVGQGDFAADGSGSGVVFDTIGYIVTNEHVVNDSERVRVVFATGRVYDADVVGMDARTDLAVLKISADGLVAIEFGSSEDLGIGDPAIAVGSPLGLDGGPSLTVGVISAFDRQVRTGTAATDVLFGMLQTDAPITRGSSGGALVDAEGRLIGITSAIGVSDVGVEGIGFAIPVELVQRIIDEILAEGEVRHPFLGIGGLTDFEEQADGAIFPAGVVIQSIEPGSAAAGAGLQTGDRITAVNGDAVTTMDGLIIALRTHRVGESVDVDIQRGGESLKIAVELGERPPGI